MRVSENSNEKIQITSKNNSLFFSWEYRIQWYVISIRSGQYTIEKLNEQLNQRITDISSINSPLKIQRISKGNNSTWK